MPFWLFIVVVICFAALFFVVGAFIGIYVGKQDENIRMREYCAQHHVNAHVCEVYPYVSPTANET